MTMLRYNPYWEFDTITNELDKMMKCYDTPVRRRRMRHGFTPEVDIKDDEKSIVFEIELPGIPKDQVKVAVNDENILTISGKKEHKGEKEEKEDNTCCRNERKFGSFKRSFRLPESVDNEKIDAVYENGLLTLTIQKIVPVPPKETEININ